MSLRGCVCVVTGASGELGGSVARLFQSCGATVIAQKEEAELQTLGVGSFFKDENGVLNVYTDLGSREGGEKDWMKQTINFNIGVSFLVDVVKKQETVVDVLAHCSGNVEN
jgi:NAD(P)-dependent dehydrogenase (short-subunit alcohol dehydrogenase family)